MFLYRNRWRSSCSRIRRFEGAGRPILLLAMGVCLLSAVGCGTVTPLTTVPTNVVLPVGGVEVPVAIVTNQIYMDVMINGTGPHRFALDTGSALSLISPTVADQFPANQLNSFTTLLGPFGPTSRFQLFRVDSLGIGNMEFQNFSAAIQDAKRNRRNAVVDCPKAWTEATPCAP